MQYICSCMCLYVCRYAQVCSHFLNACLNASKSSCFAAGGMQHSVVSATSTSSLLLGRLIRARVAYAARPKCNRSVLIRIARFVYVCQGICVYYVCMWLHAFPHSTLSGKLIVPLAACSLPFPAYQLQLFHI